MSKTSLSAVSTFDFPSSSPDVSAYVPDLEKWPDSWMIDQPDRAMGKAIVAVLTQLLST